MVFGSRGHRAVEDEHLGREVALECAGSTSHVPAGTRTMPFSVINCVISGSSSGVLLPE
jgi:hypothetical protein